MLTIMLTIMLHSGHETTVLDICAVLDKKNNLRQYSENSLVYL